jgi:hypothetical protein
MHKMLRKCIRTTLLLAAFMASSACAKERDELVLGPDWGEVSIGSIPAKQVQFVRSDCKPGTYMYADCSAVDAAGRKYVFFDGALSRVSVTDVDAASDLELPFGLVFGESVESAINKVVKHANVKAVRSHTDSGEIVATWENAFRSREGVTYSLELVVSPQRGLQEVAFVTDF